MAIEAILFRFVRIFAGCGYCGLGGGEVADDLLIVGLKRGLLDVGSGNLETVEEEGGLAPVNGGGEDAAQHPLQGGLDGVGVFEQEKVSGRGEGRRVSGG